MLNNKKNKIQELSARSFDALGVFRKTLTSLTSINEEIGSELTLREEQIAVLKSEQQTLTDTQVENTKFINKIQDLLN